MPTVQVDKLRGIVEQLFVAAGASQDEAKIVARHSVAANLAGHDSHGVIQIPIYLDRIEKVVLKYKILIAPALWYCALPEDSVS